MCTVAILRRPGHAWPLILGANRDERRSRPWLAPARHWPDRAEVTAGLDGTAGGTWLGLNDWGVVAAVMNRPGTLGPMEGLRSRGELPLEALDHADAREAAEALIHLDPAAYRPFNLLVADARAAWWLRSDGTAVAAAPLAEGVSLITAHDANDAAGSLRIRRFLPAFAAAPPPDPEREDWETWTALLARRDHEPEGGPEDALCIETGGDFGTSSSSLIALPAPGRQDIKPVWRFAPGPPDRTAFAPVG